MLSYFLLYADCQTRTTGQLSQVLLTKFLCSHLPAFCVQRILMILGLNSSRMPDKLPSYFSYMIESSGCQCCFLGGVQNIIAVNSPDVLREETFCIPLRNDQSLPLSSPKSLTYPKLSPFLKSALCPLVPLFQESGDGKHHLLSQHAFLHSCHMHLDRQYSAHPMLKS